MGNMKIIKYQCNICETNYDWKDAIENIKVIYFTTNATFHLRDHNVDCDRHICKNCIESFKREFDK